MNLGLHMVTLITLFKAIAQTVHSVVTHCLQNKSQYPLSGTQKLPILHSM